MRKGIALIGREGRTLSPFRGGSGGAGCPPWACPRGTWGKEIINTLALLECSVLVQVQSLKSSAGAVQRLHFKKKITRCPFLSSPRGLFPPAHRHPTRTPPQLTPTPPRAGGKHKSNPELRQRRKGAVMQLVLARGDPMHSEFRSHLCRE